MNATQKSASIRMATLFFSLLLLSGCADTKWPTWITGEPEDSVLHAPRPIHAFGDTEKRQAWPAVGDMPARPKDVGGQEWRETIIKDMKADHGETLEEAARLEQESASAQKEGR